MIINTTIKEIEQIEVLKDHFLIGIQRLQHGILTAINSKLQMMKIIIGKVVMEIKYSEDKEKKFNLSGILGVLDIAITCMDGSQH